MTPLPADPDDSHAVDAVSPQSNPPPRVAPAANDVVIEDVDAVLLEDEQQEKQPPAGGKRLPSPELAEDSGTAGDEPRAPLDTPRGEAKVLDVSGAEATAAATAEPEEDVAVVAEAAFVGIEPPAVKLSPIEEKLRLCEQSLGYTFFDKKLIRNALTHSSSTSDKTLDNERLEFFGDAVLDLIVREHLYHNYPTHQEGDLTEAKSSVVCRASLAKASKKMGLKSFLILGRGIGKKRAVPDSLLADAYEAIVAAIYLDGGYQPARNFVLMTLRDEIPRAMQAANSTNFKSNLQKHLQQQKHSLPTYKVLDSSGPEHSRVFEVAVFIGEVEMGRGSGSSKKSAEQEAARIAMERLGVDGE